MRVETTGLRELRRDLRRVDTDKSLRDELKAGNEKVADIAGDRIRQLLRSSGRAGARAADAVRALRRQDAPTLAFEGRVFPGVHGQLWGALHDMPRVGPSGRQYRGYNQFPTVAERSWPGVRGIPYRAVDDEAERIVGEYADIIEGIITKGR